MTLHALPNPETAAPPEGQKNLRIVGRLSRLSRNWHLSTAQTAAIARISETEFLMRKLGYSRGPISPELAGRVEALSRLDEALAAEGIDRDAIGGDLAAAISLVSTSEIHDCAEDLDLILREIPGAAQAMHC